LNNNLWSAALAKHYNVFNKPAPCDYCEHRKRCGEKLLACDVFNAYVQRNQHWKKMDRRPTKEMWDKIFIFDKDEVSHP